MERLKIHAGYTVACVIVVVGISATAWEVLGNKPEVPQRQETQGDLQRINTQITQNRNEFRREGAAERRKKMQPVATEKVVVCSECDGKGKATYSEDNPIVLNGLGNPGTFECPICGGSGKLVEYESLGLSK